MDEEQQKRDLCTAVHFADICEGMERSPEEIKREVEEVFRRKADPTQPSLTPIEELIARAEARAKNEGISVDDAFSIEAKLDHEAYWAKLSEKGIVPRSEP